MKKKLKFWLQYLENWRTGEKNMYGGIRRPSICDLCLSVMGKDTLRMTTSTVNGKRVNKCGECSEAYNPYAAARDGTERALMKGLTGSLRDKAISEHRKEVARNLKETRPVKHL